MNFFESQGVSLKEEDHGRMFPVSNKSKTIVDTLVNRVKELGVTIATNTVVKKLLHETEITGVETEFETFYAPCVVLTTGGRTYPSTGSTGDGYKLAKKVGHTIAPLYPTESPLISEESFICEKTLQGISLRDICLSVLNKEGKTVTSHKMDLLFTHFGVSGPAALRCSSFVNQLLETQEHVVVALDCFPDLSEEELTKQIQATLTDTKKVLKNALQTFLPERMLHFYLEKLDIADLPANQLTDDQLVAIVDLWKNFPIQIVKTFPLEKSFVTGGGIHLKEINPKTMESKMMPGLFFGGELIDINGYTGGFNITAAFCTGHSAGKHAAEVASYFHY
jgi:predicted Rossmann fold flavoprotein